METLDNILNGTSADEPVTPEVVAETPPAEAAPAEPAPETPERPRDEQGRFLPKSDKEPEPAVEPAPADGAPPAPSEESPTVPRTALLDERKKRQTLESQLAEMTARINAQAPQQPTQQPVQPLQQQPIPDQWDDPDGWASHVRQEAAEAARQEAVRAFHGERVKASAEDAMVKYPDYAERRDVFVDLANNNPALWDTMFQQRDPAGWAYSVAKDHVEMSQFGSLEARDAAKRKEWETEAMAALQTKLSAPSVPPTLSGERSVGSRTGPEWSGPKTLADILQ